MFFCLEQKIRGLQKASHPIAPQLMVNGWFGILGVPVSNNPFHKGIPRIQTTNPNHQLTISWAPKKQELSTRPILYVTAYLLNCARPISCSHISELCLEPFNLLCSEPLSSHSIPDSTRFIPTLCIGPVWALLLFSYYPAVSHGSRWNKARSSFRLPRRDPHDPTSNVVTRHASQRNSSSRATSSVFYIYGDEWWMSKKMQRWPVLKNEAVVVAMPPDMTVTSFLPQKPLALEADVGAWGKLIDKKRWGHDMKSRNFAGSHVVHGWTPDRWETSVAVCRIWFTLFQNAFNKDNAKPLFSVEAHRRQAKRHCLVPGTVALISAPQNFSVGRTGNGSFHR